MNENETAETTPAAELEASALNNLVMRTHETIYLIPTEEGMEWCVGPAPGNDMEENYSVRYVRSDIHEMELKRLSDMLLIERKAHIRVKARVEEAVATLNKIY